MHRGAGHPESRRAAFTLVELVTVVAILGILVTLGIGAIQGVQNSMARAATFEMFRGLESGLGAFRQDWGKYPWYGSNVTVSINTGTGSPVSIVMGDPTSGQTTSDPKVTLTTSTITDATQKAQFALYRGLNLPWRKGPYFRGNAATTSVQVGTGFFTAYADGWGRAILYDKPDTSLTHAKPKLTSMGPKGVDATATERLTNYDH